MHTLEKSDRSAIILADISEGKFSRDKGLLKLDNKPLLYYVIGAVKSIVNEVIVVTSSEEQADQYSKVSPPNICFKVGSGEPDGTLNPALTGFEAAQGKYSLLLPFDSPFVSRDVVSLLFECAIGKTAVVSRRSGEQIEPLHAVYNTKKAAEAARNALAHGETDVETMVSKLQGVRYISSMVIEQLDPDFQTFFRIKTPLDLKRALVIKKGRKIE